MLSHTRQKKLFRFSVCICTHSAICSLHFVSGLQSAFCTYRYLWHQYSLILVTVICTIYTIYHKIPVCELILHFCSFCINTLLSYCKNVDITYNVSSNPPTPQKITLACTACLCFFIWKLCTPLKFPGVKQDFICTYLTEMWTLLWSFQLLLWSPFHHFIKVKFLLLVACFYHYVIK